MLRTPAKYAFGSMWKDVSNIYCFNFRVRAQSDVNLALSQQMGNIHDDSMSRITIGASNNTYTRISSGLYGPVNVETKTNGILSPLRDLAFWVSWFNRSIQVSSCTG